MLPSAAEMPPCAATVCERVGNTLVMQAVRRPFWARPKVARRTALPAPTTSMSYLCSVILSALVIEDLVLRSSAVPCGICVFSEPVRSSQPGDLGGLIRGRLPHEAATHTQ